MMWKETVFFIGKKKGGGLDRIGREDQRAPEHWNKSNIKKLDL